MKLRGKRTFGAAFLLLFSLLALGGWTWWHGSKPKDTSSSDLFEFRDLLKNRDLPAAERLARKMEASRPESTYAILALGELALARGDPNQAIDFFSRIPAPGSNSADAQAGLGEALMLLGRASSAERRLRAAVESDPGLNGARIHLATLLSQLGDRFEARDYWRVALQRGPIPKIGLLSLAGAHTRDSAAIERFSRGVPTDPLLELAFAQRDSESERWAEAISRLSPLVKSSEIGGRVQALLGPILAERPDGEFERWNEGVGQVAEIYPGVWLARATWAQRENDSKGAARCLWEAVKRDPDSRDANYRLGIALAELDRASEAQPFLKRAELLEKLQRAANLYAAQPHQYKYAHEAAGLCEELGRKLEARGWYGDILSRAHGDVVAGAAVSRLSNEISSAGGEGFGAKNPADAIDLALVPLPRISKAPGNDSPKKNPDSTTPSTSKDQAHAISFVEQAKSLGIDFQYFNAAAPATPGARMYEFTGGGVAVIDFDGDHWPDLYFTQGSDWPTGKGSSPRLDTLWRNLGDRFERVDGWADLGDERFGQGVACGDFDDDGFADLYVANIGLNRLYRNQGDGTFLDETVEAGIAGETWTTSCLIADLDGDSLPDLYDATYAEGPDVYDRICARGRQPAICPPTVFAAAPDRVWINLGDGRFEERSRSLGLVGELGYGLGLVAADFSGDGRLGLFVANDQTDNFHFVPTQGKSPNSPPWEEVGRPRGLAADHSGRPQACMGVAAGDANDDGQLDLFVTNFYEEANALYVRSRSGGYRDISREAGLAAPSFSKLGFGAQFLDADLDGRLDLLVANGHIADLTASGIPYRMRPQFFRNTGRGRFTELEARDVGEYFSNERLGRAVARLDWNRDGREEACVTQLEGNVDLLTNVSQESGHFLALRLVGVRQDRDAIGAIVRARVGETWRTRQLTAGDGYQASNERRLVFGLSENQEVDELVIAWRGGESRVISNLAADTEWLWIEGADRPIRLTRP